MSFRRLIGIFGEVFLTFILQQMRDVKAIWCSYGGPDVIVLEPNGVLFRRRALIEVKTRDMRKRWSVTPSNKRTILRMQSERTDYDWFIAFIPYFMNKEEGFQIAIYLIPVNIIDVDDPSWFGQSRFKGEHQLLIAKIIKEAKKGSVKILYPPNPEYMNKRILSTISL